MRLLSDRIQEFIDWLKQETDFGQWDEGTQDWVHKKLIECMISDPPVEKKKHDWYFYMNGTFCTKCNAPLGDTKECKG